MSTIAIVGSRPPKKHAPVQEHERFGELLAAVTEFVARVPVDTAIVSGGAAGVDNQAWIAASHLLAPAEERHLVIRPDYKRYGPRQAPLVRNQQIAQECDAMVAFWNGKSRGTMHAVRCARKLGKPVWIWSGA